MPVFAFEAVDTTGKKIRQEVEAGNKADAIQQIKSRGLRPTKLQEKKGATAAKAAPAEGEKKGGLRLFDRVTQQQITQFTQQLATLQDAGLPIVRSLKILSEQMDPGRFKDQIDTVTGDVEQGSTFSESLEKFPGTFDNLFVAMVKAGEAGGVLDVILDRLSDFMEKSLRLKKKVKGAMIYPIVVSTVAVTILGIIMTVVIPKFEEMFADIGSSLPLPTQILLTISNTVGNVWFLLGLPVFIVVAVVGYKAIASSDGGGRLIDNFKLRAPIFGQIIRKSTISRFCRTLGTLIASGVPILEALSIVRDAVGNRVIADAIQDVHGSIREGESIAQPLAASGVFDPLLVNMIDIGEETGELDKMLNKIADNYDLDVDVLVDSLSSLLEPVLIVGMGIAVAFIVIALFLPLVSLIQTL